MEDYYNYPMKIEDAAGMLRVRIPKNEKPFTVSALQENNRLVDEWKKTVLKKMADSKGMIPSGRVWPSWLLFYEGKMIKKYTQLKDDGFIVRPPARVVDYWKVLFEKGSVEDLHKLGSATVSYGWGIIRTELERWYVEQKWDKLYSKSPDPLFWEKNYHKHADLFNGKIFPIWGEELLKEIQEKVSAVLFNQVKVK
jgi:hypothetical protein